MKRFLTVCYLAAITLSLQNLLAITPMAEDRTIPEKEKNIIKEHKLHWWERWFTHPYKSTPAEQLAYAEELR